MNCGIAPDVSFFYSNLVPFPVLAKEGHPPCRSHILAVHSFQSFPDWGRAVTTHPQDTRQPQLLVLFWFSCLKALAGQAGVWTWSLSCPGLAVPARGIVGQRGIALLCPTGRGCYLTPSRHHFWRGDQLSGTAIRPASARGTAR